MPQNAAGIDPEVQQKIEDVIKVYEKLGVKVARVKIPTIDYSAAVYFIVSRAEAASNLARFDGVRYGFRNKDTKTLNEMYEETRHDGFGSNVRNRILIGNYVLSAGHAAQFYNKAKKVQSMMRQQFSDVYKNFDLLISPVQSAPAFKLGEFADDKLKIDLQDYFTCFSNLTGEPALSLPCGFSSNNLPIGYQLIGPHLSEELLFQVGNIYQANTNWHNMHPKI